jgi:hypothetical protein
MISGSNIHFLIDSGFVNASQTLEAGAAILTVLLMILSPAGDVEPLG